MPETKPLLIFDGDCNFCRRWIARWRAVTGGRVEYAPYQEVGGRYPQIPRENFMAAVQLVEGDGRIFSAAHAAFRTLSYTPSRRWLLWCYERIPPFRAASEWFYRLVASHRVLFSRITRWLWGDHLEPSTYLISRTVFLRALGLAYFCAFASLGVQMVGLLGANGVLPAGHFLSAIAGHFGPERFWFFPSLAWISASDLFLQVLGWGGALLGILVLAGLTRAWVFLALWLFYLSLQTVGQEFLSYQWDILLLETGFLAIFIAPFSVARPKKDFPPVGEVRTAGIGSLPVSWPLFRVLLKWLLFRLMFSSGASKLLSGDLAWRNLTALNFHYETQPLPTWVGWYAHQLPGWFQSLSVLGVFAAEILMPLLIFAPRRLRHLSSLAIMVFQVAISLTGNYCFFNLLTVALCVLLLDDASWPQIFRQSYAGVLPETAPRGWQPRLVKWTSGIAAGLVFLVSLVRFSATLQLPIPWPSPVIGLNRLFAPFKVANYYGLFAIMTTGRLEIVMEGSQDGENWSAYEFKYKPGDPKGPPRFVAPHQPRVDWQMWFAALSDYRRQNWFTNFCVRMLEGSPEVLRLLRTNPFPDAPPRFLRAAAYRYHFTNWQEKKETGAWWKREREGLYMPTISLRT